MWNYSYDLHSPCTGDRDWVVVSRNMLERTTHSPVQSVEEKPQQLPINGIGTIYLCLVKYQPPSPSLLSGKLHLLAMDSMCVRQ